MTASLPISRASTRSAILSAPTAGDGITACRVTRVGIRAVKAGIDRGVIALVSVDDLQFRSASFSDAAAVAALHADSWRRHYRGAYADAFLDGDVHEDRLAVWTERLRAPCRRSQTILAEDDDRLVAFAHTVFEADPDWGALLDNLQVVHGDKRRGVGSRLLALTAHAVLERGTGLYVWVLEQNLDARAFYESHGARHVERAPVLPPGGIASRLNGSPFGLRYAWADPGVVGPA